MWVTGSCNRNDLINGDEHFIKHFPLRIRDKKFTISKAGSLKCYSYQLLCYQAKHNLKLINRRKTSSIIVDVHLCRFMVACISTTCAILFLIVQKLSE